MPEERAPGCVAGNPSRKHRSAEEFVGKHAQVSLWGVNTLRMQHKCANVRVLHGGEAALGGMLGPCHMLQSQEESSTTERTGPAGSPGGWRKSAGVQPEAELLPPCRGTVQRYAEGRPGKETKLKVCG